MSFRDAMIARGELDRDAPRTGGRAKRMLSGSLENNIRGLISGMDLTRVEERRQTLENLKRITSLKLNDPVLDEFELTGLEARRRKERLDGLVEEMEREFERLISSMEASN